MLIGITGLQTNMKKLIATLLFISFTTLALGKEVRLIHKGDPAPFDGYVFDLEAEKANRIELLEKDSLISQVELYKVNEELYAKNTKMWQDTATQNTERLLKIEHESFWQNSVYFGLGVVLTGALAIGLSKGLK